MSFWASASLLGRSSYEGRENLVGW